MFATLPQLLLKLNRPTPRYTSYPTAPEWSCLSPSVYVEKLELLSRQEKPLSLYFHIPFCKTMCLYCGCSVVLNRRVENEERYVAYLEKEIDLVCSYLGRKKRVVQLHFGGGTPTKLSISLLTRLFEKICSSFEIDFSNEVAIEIDPRTVGEDGGEKLRFLKKIGFNRVSFGVQDTNLQVQNAVKRRQTLEMTLSTYTLARELGFSGINIDLIYGLPYQTIHTFEKTTEHILEMRPDRIAFFSYAKVPWLKSHQKAIREETLPSTVEKFQIYANARRRFVEDGYVALGMDHFALETDGLAIGYRQKNLQRNFQGYSLKCAEDMIGFGITSVGFLHNAYFQNEKELSAYYTSLDKEILPIHRGKILSFEDRLRKWVIHTLMCNFELKKDEFQHLFTISFDSHFSALFPILEQHAADGLLVDTPEKIIITPLGELFIRIVAATFDAYIHMPVNHPKFSQAV